MGAMKVWADGAWQTVAPFSERASVFVGPSQPAGATYAGDLWWDTDDPSPSMPGAELSYTQITTPVVITATTAATAQTVVTCGPVTLDGSPIVVEFYAPYIEVPASHWVVADLWDGATDLGQHSQVGPGTGGTSGAGTCSRRRLTPTAGSHTFTMRCWVTSGTGKVDAGLGTSGATYAPAYLRITRV